MGTRPGFALAAVGRLSGVEYSVVSNTETRTTRSIRGARVFAFANGDSEARRPAKFLICRALSLSLLFLIPFVASAQDLTLLSAALTGGDTEQKRDALFQIRNLRSEEASRAALPALKDREPVVRATAAASVVFLPKPEAVAALVPLLDDRDPFVRKEAAYALGAVESPDASAPLARILQREKDLEVRAAAAVALGSSGNVTAVEPLLGILRGRPSEETEFLRRSAARSIGQIAQILKTSDGYVVTPRNFLPDKNKSLPGGDLAAKLNVFNAAASVLGSVLRDGSEADDTRREAAFALGAIGSETARAVLESHRNSSDPYLAEISREALLAINRR